MATRKKASKGAEVQSFGDALAVLGLDKDSCLEDAKEAYRIKAGKLHPDRTRAETSESMGEINVAWVILKTALPTREQKKNAAAKLHEATAASEKKAKAKLNKSTIKMNDDGKSVSLEGRFTSETLIEVLYYISGDYLKTLGSVVKDPAGMVDLFRAFSTGRVHRVFSLGMLDTKGRIIRTEELTDEVPDIRTIATLCLNYGAAKAYLVVNSSDGAVPKTLNPAQRNKFKALREGLDMLDIELLDYLIVGQGGYYSIKESSAIGRDVKAAA